MPKEEVAVLSARTAVPGWSVVWSIWSVAKSLVILTPTRIITARPAAFPGADWKEKAIAGLAAR